MFENLSDQSVMTGIKTAVETEKKSTARVLEYLAVVDKRRLWVKEGYSSLFDFCVRYLKYSEGESYRRIQAARLTSRVEEVKPLLESGTLSLTAMSLLSPYLTEENAKEILPKVVNTPTRDVEKVINEHFPQAKKRKETITIELTDELKALLEQAKRLASEKDPTQLMTKVLKSYVRERRPRKSKVKRHTRYVQVPESVRIINANTSHPLACVATKRRIFK